MITLPVAGSKIFRGGKNLKMGAVCCRTHNYYEKHANRGSEERAII
jgi:hypothetical protein